MGIYIHRNLGKIGKTRINYSKRIDGKNGCLSECLKVCFMPVLLVIGLYTLLFKGIAALIRAVSKKSVPTSENITNPTEEYRSIPNDTTGDGQNMSTEQKKEGWSMKKKVIVGVVAFVLIVGGISSAMNPEETGNPEETTEITESIIEPERGMPVFAETEALTETVTEAETVTQTEAVTEVVTEVEKETEAPKDEYKLVLSVTDPVNCNAMATLTAKGKPNTMYHISVYYSKSASKAEGLEEKTSDANGNVSWTWKVGANTTPGEHSIKVYAKENKKDTAEIKFTTTAEP